MRQTRPPRRSTPRCRKTAADSCRTALRRFLLRWRPPRARAFRSRQARAPARAPVPPHRIARGGWKATFRLDRDCGLDMRMRVVTLEFEVLVTEAEDVLHVRVDVHGR